MSKAVYNSVILDVPSNTAQRASRVFICVRRLLSVSTLIFALASISVAADWNAPEQTLAKRIFAITGTARVAVTFENRSSLGKRDSDIIENGLRAALQNVGLRLMAADQSSESVLISLSENATSFVWIAQIHLSTGDPVVVMVSTSRPEGSGLRDSVPLNIRKIPLYAQQEPILDVAILEESSSPARIAVLDPERVSLHRMQNEKWQLEQVLMIRHDQPWPRDLRGRLVLTHDHALEVYLPGVTCTASLGSPANLDCRQSDDPWPLLAGDASGALTAFPSAGIASGTSTMVPQTKAFFAPTRNFFTGVVTPAIGKFTTVPKFFSAAPLPRGNDTLWLFAGTDRHTHIVDGVSDQIASVAWGSDLVSVKTACGAGWQILASGSSDAPGDSIRAYELPDRDPVAVSREIDFDGAVTALWTEPRGDTAVVVSRNRDTGTYEAFRLAMACGQ